MDNNQHNKRNGSVETALNRQFTLSPQAILNEGWEITKTAKLSIVIAWFVINFFSNFVSFFVIDALGGAETVLADPSSMMLLMLVVTLVVWPFLAGIEMMGIAHSVGEKTKSGHVFKYLNRGSWVALTALFALVAVLLGLTLYVIPGIYLLIALSASVQLTVEKKLSPLTSIIYSLRAYSGRQWFQLFLIYTVLFILSFITVVVPLALFPSVSWLATAITFLGFCYLIPLAYNVRGIIYRETFGVSGKDNQSPDESTTSNTFEA